MKSVFADSQYFIALLNPRDASRRTAIEASRHRSGQLITGEWILLEVGDAMASPLLRDKYAHFVDTLYGDQSVTIISLTSSLFHEVLALYRARLDKGWPMTDCLSFVTMRQHGMHEAFTSDRHFEQAGFAALLRAHQRYV